MARARPRRRPDGVLELAPEGRVRRMSLRAATVAGLAPAAVLTAAALLALLPLLLLALPGAALSGAAASALWWRRRRGARRDAAILRGPGAA